MNKPLLGSIVAATILLGDASAATLYERFEAMEKEMQALQEEVNTLRAEKAQAQEAASDEEEDEASEGDGPEDGEGEEDEASDGEGGEGPGDGEDGEGEDDEEEEGGDETAELLEELEESVHEINRNTAGNHLKFDVDFRTSYDNLQYEMAGTTATIYTPSNPLAGETVAGAAYYKPTLRDAALNPLDPTSYTKQVEKDRKNDGLLTNRLWINMNWAANENMSFTGQLAYNKTYGGRFGNQFGAGSAYEEFDWFVNENANGDGNVRIKNAYWFYRNDTFLGTDIPWTMSIGRRPSTNGHLINLRDDDPAASPTGHTINVEFDGLSSKFSFEKVTGIPGMYIKLCAGQGVSSASEKFSATPYSNESSGYDVKDVQLAGFIFVPYDNGQFSIGTQFYGALNLPGQNIYGGTTGATDDSGTPLTPGALTGLTPVGNLYSGAMYMMLNGIGDGWADFLDDTTFFVSGAVSQTDPNDKLDQFGQQQAMLGSIDKETGHSYWVGLNMPSLFSDDGRFGIEYNHGSEYWRSITYGEDTMIGSKVATRGDAYEIYFTEPLVEDSLSLQIRYTYIDYEYSGSNGFFGNATGTPYEIAEIDTTNAALNSGNIVDVAQDLRVYLRYRF